MFVCLACAVHVNARKSESAKDTKSMVGSIPLIGCVYDRLTSHHIIGVKVEILNADSSLVSTVRDGLRDFKCKQGDAQRALPLRLQTPLDFCPYHVVERGDCNTD